MPNRIVPAEQTSKNKGVVNMKANRSKKAIIAITIAVVALIISDFLLCDFSQNADSHREKYSYTGKNTLSRIF